MPVLPLGASDILQQSYGTNNGATSVEVSLPAGTQAGKTVVILVANSQASTLSTLNTPSGFTYDGDRGETQTGQTNHVVYAFHKSNTSAGEGVAGSTGWTVSTANSGSAVWAWWVLEIDRLDLSSPKVGQGGADSIINNVGGNTPSTGSTGVVARNDTIVLSLLAARTSMSAANFAGYDFTTPTGSSDPYTLISKQRTSNSSGVNLAIQCMRSLPFPVARSLQFQVNTTGTTNAVTNDTFVGIIVSYASAGSGRPDPLDFHTGFEYGHHGGLTASPLTSRQLASSTAGTWGTNFLIQGASARSGSYGLRVVQSAAAAYVRWDTNKLGTTKDDCVIGVGVKVVSVTTDPAVLVEINPAAGVALQLVYATSTSKLGLRWGSGGTVSYQTRTVATGTWAWVDIVADGLNSTSRSGQWFVDGLEEDGPADLTGQTTGGLTSVNLGGNVAQTVTADFDDLCVSTNAPDYPLGKTKVLLLTVDPAGTVSIVGTTGNFQTFASNGTLTAWNATTARGAIDEVPPTISASADGIAQITTATGDYVAIPFSTYTLATGEYFQGVAIMFALWANATQTLTVALDITAAQSAGNVLTTATSFNPGNAAQPASATVPTWAHNKRPSTNSAGWTQTDINNLSTTFGASSDAAPDVGMHVVYAEVAVAEAIPAIRIYGPDQDGLTVDVTRAWGNYAVETYEITAGTTRNATLRYVQDGAEVTQAITAGSGASSVTVDAAYIDQVSRVTVEPDPLPWPEV